jgi:hypothetical protein
MITQAAPKRCDTSASLREIPRKLQRYRGVRDAPEIRILPDRIGSHRNIDRADRRSGCRALTAIQIDPLQSGPAMLTRTAHHGCRY